MRIEERVGDLFEAPQKILGHGVNCQGVMGAGIAKRFADRYPDMYYSYVSHSRDWLRPGMCSFHFVEEGKVVVNLATQDKPGPNARYGWVVASIVSAVSAMSNVPVLAPVREMAIPRIGCGIGGLLWPVVKKCLEEAGWDHYTLVVYSLETT